MDPVHAQQGKLPVSLHLPLRRCAFPVDPSPRALPPEQGQGETCLVMTMTYGQRMLMVECCRTRIQTLAAEDGPSGLTYCRSAARIDMLAPMWAARGMNGSAGKADAARQLRLSEGACSDRYGPSSQR